MRKNQLKNLLRTEKSIALVKSFRLNTVIKLVDTSSLSAKFNNRLLILNKTIAASLLFLNAEKFNNLKKYLNLINYI